MKTQTNIQKVNFLMIMNPGGPLTQVFILEAVRRYAAEIVAAGVTWLQLTWGENQITLERMGAHGPWIGSGWIGRHGGQDLANELRMR